MRRGRKTQRGMTVTDGSKQSRDGNGLIEELTEFLYIFVISMVVHGHQQAAPSSRKLYLKGTINNIL